MPRHKLIASKMIKTKPLLDDPILSQYVPELHWFSKEKLKRMLFQYGTVYVKPDEGSLGIGVRRLKRINDTACILETETSSKKISISKACKILKREQSPKELYLIQEGIDLSTYKGCPFHIRVVMQKPMNRWQVSMMCATVGRKNAVITNYAYGGDDVSVEKAMNHRDQNWDPINTFRELIYLSHQVVACLGSKLPLLLVGLDMGIDKNGKIWFIEANTRPDMDGMKELNDKLAYRKYMEAKRWVGHD
ncbi:YheC/YheD family protein [Ammoniphilus sp. YIM 78166]|uniref:YheC/YheD family protein n=1 Tax=Ammoniphilus sp. YIM 78166 TaxID=1644106 RepID=UPI00106F588E|nr:YheC/YheD family protein [Ammoniphilus sp. YIM 78166]